MIYKIPIAAVTEASPEDKAGMAIIPGQIKAVVILAGMVDDPRLVWTESEILPLEQREEHTYFLAGNPFDKDTREFIESLRPLRFDVNQSSETVNFAPREYNFQFADCKIECDQCRAVFDWRELQSDSAFDGEDDVASDTCCPQCGTWNCCGLTFESVKEFMARGGKVSPYASEVLR